MIKQVHDLANKEWDKINRSHGWVPRLHHAIQQIVLTVMDTRVWWKLLAAYELYTRTLAKVLYCLQSSKHMHVHSIRIGVALVFGFCFTAIPFVTIYIWCCYPLHHIPAPSQELSILPCLSKVEPCKRHWT